MNKKKKDKFNEEKMKAYIKEFSFWCRVVTRYARVCRFKCETEAQKNKQFKLMMILGILKGASEAQMIIIKQSPIPTFAKGGVVVNPKFK